MTISDKRAVQTIGSRIWGFFGSLRLTLFVLFSLAAFSVVGTVIQQNQPTEFYSGEYGKWAPLILRIGLEDMYHAWWFSTLLLLLILNIIVCTIDRFPPKWKTTLESKADVDARFIKNLLNKHTLILQDEPAFVRERILNILRKRRYNVKEAISNRGAEGMSIYAWKGRTGRFGSDVVHVSLLLILCGVIIGSITGFKDFGAFYEGEVITVPVTELRLGIDRSWHGIPLPKIDRQKKASDIQLRLDKFWIDYYESGQIKQYNSVLTLSDSGREIIKGRQIWVNAPLSYKGITFYQSSYGTAYDRVKQAEFLLKRSKTHKTITPPFTALWNTPYDIPGTDYRIKVVGFVSDFAFDPATRTVFPKSAEHNNPAINIEVYKMGKLVSRPWLFYNYADLFAAMPDSDYELVFSGYKGILYTGLSINKDPGTNVVWIGSALMVVGFFLAFFIFHQRIWVNIRKGSLETEVYIGGMINKNKFIFERELSEIVDDIKSGSSGGIKQ
ncbi:MAG TPA: cytochrome c biogenesis protein ResB [Thermodesulfobacteriota bacterium]|nr:cytochrome c biogenesis protein ResB [Thermodesulfobacteriota bacterium]